MTSYCTDVCHLIHCTGIVGRTTIWTKRTAEKWVVSLVCIKTHSGESQGQEEADLRDEPVSYLQVAPL